MHLGFASAAMVQMGFKGDAYFSLLTHTKQLLLVTFCDKTAGSGVRFRTHGTRNMEHGRTDRRTDGQTDMEVEIVIKIQCYLACVLSPSFCSL